MNNTTFPTSFCFRVGKHKRLIARTEFCCNAIIQRIFLKPSDCLFLIQLIVYNEDPEQRVSDGGQDPRVLTPSKLCILNCTTHSLNQQSNWSTNRLISEKNHVPLQRNFQKLKILSVNGHIPCLLLFSSLTGSS